MYINFQQDWINRSVIYTVGGGGGGVGDRGWVVAVKFYFLRDKNITF